MNYYGGDSSNGPRARMALDDTPYVPPHDGFYTTDAFTDHAIAFLDEAMKRRPAQPFFLYMPYNASHWPLQAPEAEVETYRGKYDEGWQSVRRARLKRQVELGIVPRGQAMAAMDRGNVPPWDQLSDEQRKQWARRMEVYAAQTEHLDRAIGKLLDAVRRLGVEQDTLVIFLSDNGGAAEDPNRGDPWAPLGGRDSFRGYGRPWATVSNTPWRLHKVTPYEGGISTPLIAYWPAGIPAERRGTLVREPAHLIDLLPTFLALAGATYPTVAGGAKPEGRDITTMLKGGRGAPDRTFFWEHEGHRAIRKGRWKLVMLASSKQGWELYDIEADRTESHDVAREHPEIVHQLSDEYGRWATRCGVVAR
jgi:arylsulfatase